MKKLKIILIGVLLCAQASAQHSGKQLFNNGWKFHLGNFPDAIQNTFNDDNWETVMLPHDWSVAGPFSQKWASATGYLPAGIGWYRKTFNIPANTSKDIWSIYFDGVYKNAEVWINGHYLGKRPNGFIAFHYDLSPYLSKDGKNTIAVKVDHNKFADSRWYTGSGIYRNVYLIHSNPIHINTWGVDFQTAQLTNEQAQSTVITSIANRSENAVPVAVFVELRDDKGKVVVQQTQRIQVTSGKSQEITMHLMVDNPQRWSVERPYLYELSVKLLVDQKEVDSYHEQVGFRNFHFDANKGFSLNGQNMKLKGVCIHDDAGALGVAVAENVWRRRLQVLKEGGVNAIRMSHNPHADYLYTLCDQLGLLVMDEAFDEWEFGKNKWIAGWNVGTPGKDGYHDHYKDWALQDLKDMILRNRNRPSIIMWSIGNEVDYPNDPYSHEVLSDGKNPQIYGKGYLPDHPPANRLGELSKLLVDAAKEIDTTRAITAALAGVVMSNTTSYPSNIDIVGYNYQEYRYPEDHQQYPDRIIYGSENGMQYNAWLAVDTNDFISGQFLWTGIDYLGEAGKWPSRSNGAGLLDLAGFPKPEYYFRQSLWAAKPMIYIGTSPVPEAEDNGIWSHKRAAPVWGNSYGETQRVTAFSNTEEVELYLNGKSMGRKAKSSSQKGYLWWDIPYQDGELMAKAFNAGKEVADFRLTTTGKAVKLKMEMLSSSKNSELRELLIEAVDESGKRVFMANDGIEIDLQGEVLFRGMENGNHLNTTSYLSKNNQLYEGKLILYIQKLNSSKDITVNVNSSQLKGVSMRL